MSERDGDDRELIALIANEQKSFRTLLVSGLAVLLVLIGMSAALGFYYFNVARGLGLDAERMEVQFDSQMRALQKQAFDARRAAAVQTNRLASNEVRLQEMHDELRQLNRPGNAPELGDEAAAIVAAGIYLREGRLSFQSEQLIAAFAAPVSSDANGASNSTAAGRSLLSGVSALIVWNRRNESIRREDGALPRTLDSARGEFEAAGADPALAEVASIGRAWIAFLYASSPLSNYRREDCENVYQYVSRAGRGDAAGPQPLYWRAQCERKLGQVGEALRDYSLSLELSLASGTSQSWDFEQRTLAMNGFHGVGTTLIGANSLADNDRNVRQAVRVATRACQPDDSAQGSPRMLLAVECLRRAMEQRMLLRQTPNQMSGSGENLSFAYLRDADFQRAFDNARDIETTGHFAWNELVRALTVRHIESPPPEVREAADRNVSFFEVGEFNVCELRGLLNETLYEEALAIIREQHPGETVACANTEPAEGTAT